MGMMDKIAEVIATTSTEFTAQCYKLNSAPSLGTLVKTIEENGEDIFGVVYNIETHSMETGRRVSVRGEKINSVQEIYRTNPQLEKLLVTDFNVVIVGCSQQGKLCYYIASQPSFIHSFVYICQAEEVRKFAQSLDFLNLLVEPKLAVSTDEVLAASLRFMSNYCNDPRSFLINASKELVWILRGDLYRLNSILKRVNIG